MEPASFCGESGFGEGAVEVGDDVFDVFDADGETDEAVGDSGSEAHVAGNGSVGHKGGKGN